MADDRVQFNDKVLQKLIKALGSVPEAKVGILGDKDTRAMQKQNAAGTLVTHTSSNATIGAAHEFGTSKMPKRSFLRMPLEMKLKKTLEQAGAFNEETLKKVIQSGSARAWVEKVAISATATIADAFGSNGFGKWAPHATGYTNNTGDILTDTTQLRNSITWQVED